MADRYWVGGTGTWDTATTTNWSAASGGASGASVPTVADNVFFDQAGTYTVTMAGALFCLDITVSAGTVTFSAGTSPTLNVRGSMSLLAGTVWSMAGTITFSSTSTGRTITTNGTSLGGGVTFSGAGGGWTLGSALTTGNIQNFTILQGTFNTSNYNVSCGAFQSTGSLTRTINLGSSTITYGVAVTGSIFTLSGSNLTFNAGTSTFTTPASGITFAGGGYTFYNVTFTNGTAAGNTISGANTFNTLSFAGRTSVGVNTVNFAANQTISTLTLNAGTASAYRTFLRSDTIGTQRTLSVGTLTAGAADYDFQDIAITGAASPIAPTRAGDCKGNSGITFPAAKTVYYRSSGSTQWGIAGSSAWSLTNGGAADVTAFPLAQDTAVFPSSPTPYPSSGTTSTINASYNIGTIDMSARTSATMTLATGTTTPTIYGNWINGTVTTLTGTGRITFSGRGSQTITSAGKTFPQPFTLNTPGGSVTLQDAFASSSASSNVLGINTGTFDSNGYAVNFTSTLPVTQFGTASGGTSPKTLAIGSSTWTLAGSGSVWSVSGSNLTVTGTGTINLTSTNAKTFAGNDVQTYPTINQGGTGALTITGSNKFAAMTNTAIGSVLFTGGTTNEFTSSFSLNGSAVSSLTLSSTNTTQAILKKPSAWLMGLLSTNAGNNTGLTFVASDGTMEYLTVSYINGQTTVTYTGAGNFFPFFS